MYRYYHYNRSAECGSAHASRSSYPAHSPDSALSGLCQQTTALPTARLEKLHHLPSPPAHLMCWPPLPPHSRLGWRSDADRAHVAEREERSPLPSFLLVDPPRAWPTPHPIPHPATDSLEEAHQLGRLRLDSPLLPRSSHLLAREDGREDGRGRTHGRRGARAEGDMRWLGLNLRDEMQQLGHLRLLARQRPRSTPL